MVILDAAAFAVIFLSYAKLYELNKRCTWTRLCRHSQ